MNVKSYLKGIGVGMIVASLVLIIAGNMNKMSDEDVIKRAKELGMVESTVIQNNDSANTVAVNQPESKENASAVESKDSNQPDKTEQTDSKDSSQTDTTESTDSKETNQTASNETITDDSSKPDTTEDKTANTSETVKVEVKSGMSSESVSLAVKNAGLVDDDIEFNKYLCENGYDKRLRVGSFDIPSDSDFETISKYLCGIK